MIRSYHTMQPNKKVPSVGLFHVFFFNKQVVQNYITTANIRKHLNFFFQVQCGQGIQYKNKKNLYATMHIFSVFENSW